MTMLSIVAGTASAVKLTSSTTVNTTVNTTVDYSTTSNSSSQVVTREMMNFRINNRAAYMNVKINLNDGDIVTAAGLDKGEFEVIAIHNHTTRMIYYIPEPPTYPEIIYIVLGVFTIGLMGIGFLLIGGGIWFLINKKKKIKEIRDAYDMVKKAPNPAN